MKAAGKILIYCALIYFCVASVAYRFRHKFQTETQLFLHTKDALLWK